MSPLTGLHVKQCGGEDVISVRRYLQFVTAHPIPVLTLAAVNALVFAALIPCLTRDPSPDAFIPKDHPALARKLRTDAEFGLKEPIVVAVIRDARGGIFHPPTLGLIRDLTEAIQRLPEVSPSDVLSLATESGVYFENGEPVFERLMRTVPATPEAVEALKRDILGYELYRGTLVATDGSAACIIVRAHGQQTDDRLYRELSRLVSSFPVNDERLVVAGEAAVRAHMGAAVSDDALRMNFVCPIVMALLIVLAYRTGRGSVLPLCVIGGASAMALGSMAAAHVPVYIVTNGIFVIIMALGVADSLHLLGQYYEEQLSLRGRDRRQVVVDACVALWRPLLMTTLTDFVGFFALYATGVMPPIRYFGLFTCVGVAGAFLYSFTVVPAGLAVLPLRGSRAFLPSWKGDADAAAGAPAHADNVRLLDVLGRRLGRLGSFTYRRRRPLLVICLAIIAFAVWGASKLVVNDARILAFKDDHPLVRATEEINHRFDGTSHLNVVVTAAEPGAMLRADVLRRIDALEAFTETLPYVGGAHSPAGWVKRAHQKMHDEAPAYYAIPEDEADTRFYLDVLSFPTSPMARLLLEVVDKTYTRANLIVRMKSSQFIHQREVIDRLQAYLDRQFNDGLLHAELAGRADLDDHWLELVYGSHVRSVALSLACVLALTGLMFKSATAGALCTLVVAIAVLANYAVMGLGGIPLGVGTSMFASIAIGAGVNSPIHMLDRLRVGFRQGRSRPEDVYRDALAFTGRALSFTAFIVAVGFLLLCVSQFRTLVQFGLLVGLGMVGSFLASVTLLPALVAVIKPRFIYTPCASPGDASLEGGAEP